MTETPSTPPPPEPPPPAPGPVHHSFPERVLGALRLDARIYDEIEHDESALAQAAGVVALAAVAAGIGGAAGGLGAILGGVLMALINWLIGTGIVWLIGVRMMKHTSGYMELLRTLGFAAAPQILLVLAFIPVVGMLVMLAVIVWLLLAYVVAVRQALDVDTGRAVVVCVLAIGVGVLLRLLLAGCGGAGAGSPVIG